MLPKPAKVAIGAGVVVGGFFAFHHIRKYLAQRKLDKLRALAAAGLLPPRDFLDAVTGPGQPTPGGPQITIAEAKLLPCSTVLPGVAGNPFWDAVIADMKKTGECL